MWIHQFHAWHVYISWQVLIFIDYYAKGHSLTSITNLILGKPEIRSRIDQYKSSWFGLSRNVYIYTYDENKDNLGDVEISVIYTDGKSNLSWKKTTSILIFISFYSGAIKIINYFLIKKKMSYFGKKIKNCQF